MNTAWTTPEDIAAKVRRRWDDGSLLSAYADGRRFEPLSLPVRGPTATQIGDDLGAAQSWVARLDAGRRDDSRYTLEWSSIGGRHLGRNHVPTRAIVSSFEQAWALLAVSADVRRFAELLSLADPHPSVRAWVVRHPGRALELYEEMPKLLAAYAWLEDNRGTQRYLRQINAPGVDTKFAERHRPVLAAMLGVPATASGFLAQLGLRAKPEFVRMRMAPALSLAAPLTELVVRATEVAELAIRPRAALVIENEITYLSVEVPKDGVVIWGKGFEVDRVGRLPWLSTTEVVYWGDIDTHGFAILDRLRAWLPQTRSVLMERSTLLAHRDRWVTEDRPARSRLSRLSPEEQELYDDLVTDRFGDRVRLEQERIDWAWVENRLGEEGRHSDQGRVE